jgi:integrase
VTVARVKDLWYVTKDAKRVRTERYGKGKRWLAVWQGSDGKDQTRAFDRKVDADKHGTAMEADRMRGVYVDERRGRVLLRDYADDKWLPAQVHLRLNSAETYASHLKTHIKPALGDRRLGSLTRSDMKAFVAVLTAKLAPSTVETVFAVLRSLMQSAVDDGLIPANPCSRVPLPHVEPRVVEPLPAAAIVALADKITARYRVTVWLAAGLGLREGEALGLVVPKVDFLRRRVHVHRQAQHGKLVELKTKASRRTIPADDMILGEITRHMQRDGWAPGPEQVIVTNRVRGMVQRGSFNECWREAVERAGLPKGTRYHDLRHFYASGLIKANCNPKVVQSRLGHATMPETWDTYGHLFPDDEDLGRGAIETLIADALAEPQRNTAES